MKPFDPTKPVQTRDGRPARILCTDIKNRSGRCIVAATGYSSDPEYGEVVGHHLADGQVWRDRTDNCDLVNVPAPQVTLELWVNIYAEGIRPTVHLSKASATHHRMNYCVACVPVKATYREGDGL